MVATNKKPVKHRKMKEAQAVETEPDAWERFQSAIKTVAPPKKPKDKPVAVTLDAAEFLNAISELAGKPPIGLADCPLQVRDALVDLLHAPVEAGSIESLPAVVAGELRFQLKPTDRFLRLVAAIRTGDFDLALVKNAHG